MKRLRKDILAYLAAGQASLPALEAATRQPAAAVRRELDALLEKGTITTGTITATHRGRPRYKITVYLLAEPAP